MMKSERQFQQTVLEYGESNGRADLPWRVERTPFNAFLSEIMLQQTQVPRVTEKFSLFRSLFQNFHELAEAPQSQIVTLWQGLGYNRRALYLHRSAQIISEQYDGILPDNPQTLQTLPGIGAATAASMTVYAYNYPIPFIETNVRAVYIHHFFSDRAGVSDSEIMPIVERTLFSEDPYRWYSALMDYGTMLKSQHKNPARRSVHHTKQSRFEGSRRQLRGKVLRTVSELGCVQTRKLIHFISDTRTEDVIKSLIKENMLEERNKSLFLK